MHVNTDQLYEVELTFIAERIRQRLCKLETMQEKEDLIFKFLELLQTDQYGYFYELYNSYDKLVENNGHKLRFIDLESKRNFIEEIEKEGFYIKKTPFSNIRYDTIKRIYEAFPWIKLYDVYINRFGMKKKMMNKMVVGEMYMYLLKQTSNKNFSARSTGRLNKKNLPEKSSDKKNNREVISTTPIKIGEAYNLFNSISGMTLAEFNIFMRSSPLGAKSLSAILGADDNPMKVSKLKVKKEYLNANALMLNAYLMALGLRLNFKCKKNNFEVVTNNIVPIYMDGKVLYDYQSNKKYYAQLFAIKDEFLRSHTMVTSSDPLEREHMIWKTIINNHSELVKDNPVLPKIKDLLTGENPLEEYIKTHKAN